ncbi:MAG: rhodanese-like domain-containing protein [Candidatus Neomarinimicrobiota bacterium]
MPLVTTTYLQENLNRLKIIDCSWHMPNVNRNPENEYKLEHIPNSIFFDLDKNSRTDIDLPHMLVDSKTWENIISNLGINNNDEIVIYDNSDVISSCRCWYNFIYYGHNINLVNVLDGGLKKWILENKEITSELTKITKTNYKATSRTDLVKDKKQIDDNITQNKFSVIDARSKDRFEGKVSEPRPGLRSGSIPNSKCIPFNQVLNEDKTFKNKSDLKQLFNSNLNDLKNNNVVFSCGSGVTACVLAFAYYLINDTYEPKIYDGSWAEYGRI